MAKELEFGLRDDGTLEVTAGIDGKDVVVPSSVDGIAVTGIGDYAFKGKVIQFLTISEGIRDIGEGAFSGCNWLKFVNLPSSLRTIGDKAMQGCSSLVSFDLREGLETIGSHAFDECYRLLVDRIPASVTKIGRGAISGCSLMTEVTIPDGGRYRSSPNGCIYDRKKSKLVAVCPGIRNDCLIDNGCRTIAAGAFDGCWNVRLIGIPKSVETIESGAFDGCADLRGFTLGNGTTNFTVEGRGGPALYSAFNERLIRVAPRFEGPTLYVPDEVTVISKGAFRNCRSLRAINLPENLHVVEDGAFEDARALGCLMIPPKMNADLPYEFVDETGKSMNVSERAGFRFIMNKKGKFVKSGMFKEEEDVDDFHRLFGDRRREETPMFTPVKTTGTTFNDICGQERAKNELMDRVVLPQKHPELFERYKLNAGGGVLLYGPPGTGKTMLAKAVAGELDASFYSITTTDILNKWVGESESRIHELFETARKSRPSVIFFDDFDAIGAQRKEDTKPWWASIITQLLVEMQGVTTDNKGVLVLAATNRPQDIDSALKRPGRFDVEVPCNLPNEEARAEMIKRKLSDIPHSRISYKALAEATDGYNGADMERLVTVAKRNRVKSIIKGGSENVTMKDFTDALATVKSSVRAEDLMNITEYEQSGSVSARFSDEETYVPSPDRKDDPSYR